MIDSSLISSTQDTNTDVCANSVDPDETARNEPSHQELHCFPFCLHRNTYFQQWTCPNSKMEETDSKMEETTIGTQGRKDILTNHRDMRTAKAQMTHVCSLINTLSVPSWSVLFALCPEDTFLPDELNYDRYLCRF